MKISSQLHAPATLTAGKETPVSKGFENNLTSITGHLVAKRNIPTPAGNWTPVVQPIGSCYINWHAREAPLQHEAICCLQTSLNFSTRPQYVLQRKFRRLVILRSSHYQHSSYGSDEMPVALTKTQKSPRHTVTVTSQSGVILLCVTVYSEANTIYRTYRKRVQEDCVMGTFIFRTHLQMLTWWSNHEGRGMQQAWKGWKRSQNFRRKIRGEDTTLQP